MTHPWPQLHILESFDDLLRYEDPVVDGMLWIEGIRVLVRHHLPTHLFAHYLLDVEEGVVAPVVRASNPHLLKFHAMEWSDQ